jgi:hypothetical protein
MVPASRPGALAEIDKGAELIGVLTRVCAQIIRFSSSLQFRRLRRFATKRSANVHLLTNGH